MFDIINNITKYNFDSKKLSLNTYNIYPKFKTLQFIELGKEFETLIEDEVQQIIQSLFLEIDNMNVDDNPFEYEVLADHIYTLIHYCDTIRKSNRYLYLENIDRINKYLKNIDKKNFNTIKLNYIKQRVNNDNLTLLDFYNIMKYIENCLYHCQINESELEPIIQTLNNKFTFN